LVSDTYAQSIGINPEVGGKLSDEARRNLVSKGMAAAKSRLIEGGGTFSGFPMGSEVWPLEDNSPMYLSSELAHNLDIFRSNSGSVEDDGPPDFIPTTKKMHEFRKRLGLSKMPENVSMLSLWKIVNDEGHASHGAHSSIFSRCGKGRCAIHCGGEYSAVGGMTGSIFGDDSIVAVARRLKQPRVSLERDGHCESLYSNLLLSNSYETRPELQSKAIS